MANTIEKNATLILRVLAGLPVQDDETPWLPGERLAASTLLSPSELNDAITILQEAGLVEWYQTLGTAPYRFNEVRITSRGRFELERALTPTPTPTPAQPAGDVPPLRSLSPVGSPYGFREEDWEALNERKPTPDVLFVVVGHQFESQYFESALLTANLKAAFERALAAYNVLPGSSPTRLDFRPLAAGYGEHLFNEIVRDIISSDIAVFETSDLNPNVMVELGVALTWGVRVLPIKCEGRPRPPSDISGQTWADYRHNGSVFLDPEHPRKLLRMVERAVRKKGRT